MYGGGPPPNWGGPPQYGLAPPPYYEAPPFGVVPFNTGPPQMQGPPPPFVTGTPYGGPDRGMGPTDQFSRGVVPPPAGRKKALLVACCYFNTRNQLGGCINDAKCLKYMLISRLGFREEDIRTLTDDQQGPGFWPTRRNIWDQIQWLVQGSQPGDSLFFSFSGHGGQSRDRLGEEMDGLNSTILPCDHASGGQITDNELNQWMVNPLPVGVRLHCVLDACHSGSALDLEFRCKIKNGMPTWKNEYRPGALRSYKGTSGGLAVQVAASKDSETAADTSALSGTGTPTGAATFCFIQAIEQYGPQITYGNLLTHMNRILNPGGSGGGSSSFLGSFANIGGGMLSKIIDGGLAVAGLRGGGGQTPLISANYAFDMNTPLQL